MLRKSTGTINPCAGLIKYLETRCNNSPTTPAAASTIALIVAAVPTSMESTVITSLSIDQYPVDALPTSIAAISIISATTSVTAAIITSCPTAATSSTTSNVYLIPTCTLYDRTWVLLIGLAGHLRIQRPETAEPVPGAPTYSSLHYPHCPRILTAELIAVSTHLAPPAYLLCLAQTTAYRPSHTVISSTTLSTSCTSTVPSSSYTLSPSVSTISSSTTAAVSETDAHTVDFSYVPSKLKLLRTNLGELGQRYFDALNLQKAIDLHTAFSKLESAWGEKDNVFLSRYRFCQMRQESNQCVSDFITNLTLAIQDCGYKEIKADNFEHAMLFQQLIVGLRDEKARENLLSEKKDLSWEKACDIASHRERVRQNLQQLNQSNDGVIASLESEMAVSLVNTAVSSPKQRPSAPSKQLPSCYRCGQHHIRWSDCRHQKTVCQFCKKVGHIERVCFSKRRANTNTHATYPNPTGDGEAILRMFSANAPLQSPYTITLPVDHHPVKFEIDTGSAVTLINEASLPKLPSLLPASSTFRSYTGQNVEV
nr:unnamed protein product [Spirometra erinaceieuropaei]